MRRTAKPRLNPIVLASLHVHKLRNYRYEESKERLRAQTSEMKGSNQKSRVRSVNHCFVNIAKIESVDVT